MRAAGAPPGAVQMVPCANDVAEGLVRDDRFATLSFTGSAKVGWHLKSIAGKKRVLLELGGNAAAIVHEDAAREASARIAAGAFGYAGQVCIKVQRLYVHRPIADAFVADVVARSSAIEPRSLLDPAAVCGPMIDEPPTRRASPPGSTRPCAPGRACSAAGDATAIAIGPPSSKSRATVRGLKVVDEEVFGPVLTVHRYDTWDDALAMADATRYGLQAGVFTDSRARIAAAFRRLHVGGLIVNDVPTFRMDAMPYGGTRDSGLGREGVRCAIEEMTERKLLVTREG